MVPEDIDKVCEKCCFSCYDLHNVTLISITTGNAILMSCTFQAIYSEAKIIAEEGIIHLTEQSIRSLSSGSTQANQVI